MQAPMAVASGHREMELGKTSSASSMEAMISEEPDLWNWELVDASDLDEDEEQYYKCNGIDYSYDSDSHPLLQSLPSDYSLDGKDSAGDPGGEEPEAESSADDDRGIGGEPFEGGESDDYGGEDEDGDDDDLDDELLPRSVSDRFGRDRMRKMGKRICSKMAKSKRLPYIYARPWCVHGKHGLGLKYNF